MHGKLNSLKRAERSEEEKAIADVLWIKNEELSQKLSTEAHKYVLDQVLGLDGLKAK